MFLYNVVGRMGRDDHTVDIGILCNDMDFAMKKHTDRLKKRKENKPGVG
jgi:hypothetical protein